MSKLVKFKVAKCNLEERAKYQTLAPRLHRAWRAIRSLMKLPRAPRQIGFIPMIRRHKNER